ncbi:hypothetical protein [Flagellimonas lutaonensis]|uniref:Uncharacterized protein n=1 Tax=Flagellimonas lutaonensis TaxID=516051 RepID=A0A0D5YX38_9FLAO|nr:hypothetical protein [Allomuricauda lutaonensis]AKA36454.1 hypothetical protein VC82_2909 [Allomuricauda lutaonensis]
MKKITLLVLMNVLMLSTLQAQRKSELLAEIDTLRTKLRMVEDSLAKYQRIASANEAQAKTLQNQNESLREANATLMKNLNSFSEISSKNSETVNKALASLKEKEQQMKLITNTFSSNDSSAIALITKGKQTLGEDAKLGTGNGTVVIGNSLASLFGSDTATTLAPESGEWLNRIAQFLNLAPDRKVVVQGLNITGEFGLTLQQVTAVASALIENHNVAPERIQIEVRDGNFKEGINIRLEPDHEDFYKKVKESLN